MTIPARQADWAAQKAWDIIDEWAVADDGGNVSLDVLKLEFAAALRAAELRAAERAAAIAERDVDWSQFGKRDLEPWEGGKDSVRDYRLGIVTGRAIAMAIRQETTIRSLPADPAATQDGGK